MQRSADAGGDRLPAVDKMLAGAVLAAYLAAFWPVWRSLLAAWRQSEDYSHGFFIVPIALYVLWRKRDSLGRLSVRPARFGLLLVIGSLALYLVGFLAGISTLSSLSMLLVLASGVFFLFGLPVLKECLFPLFLLLFMIPIPAQIYTALTAPLQLFVSRVTAVMVKLGGIPVIREGNILHLPQHSFQVIQACSGLRSILSLLTVSLLFAYFTLRSNRLRTLLFLSGLPVAIAVNVLRVLLMVLGFHLFGIDLTEGPVHELFGLGIFMVAILLIICIRRLLVRWDFDCAAN